MSADQSFLLIWVIFCGKCWVVSVGGWALIQIKFVGSNKNMMFIFHEQLDFFTPRFLFT